ncbi:alpha/beta fold hydrolase [Flavobacterium sp.]|jgi:pimeloyl-ACP methyl ester carboxylesterase|uniref:alpha/beta fold hydrolase n=1 Tax=Flavobacterium sp. TaxID=239 RepID=UPI002A817B4D|nr:alpha/beta fold hydrolase [Flavobacterium sp.]
MLYSKIEGEGKPFLILHGFLGMSDNWKTLGLEFSKLGYQVHMLDLRNHGRSIQSPEFNYQIMAQDVKDYCAEKGLENIVLLGHSMGGKVAMEIACAWPDLIDKLIIADIGVKFYPPHHQSIIDGLMSIDFSLKPSRSTVDEQLSQYIKDFGTRQFLLKSLYWKEPGQLDYRFNINYLNNNIDEIGKELSSDKSFEKKALFLRGGKSNYILDEDVLHIQNHFPNMTLNTVSNAGHWLHAENPLEFYDYVVNYLNS